MKLIRMKATFGNLDGRTLELEPGLNWICAPNEWGKSTWCAFLTAMFYGVDTRERTAKDRLAAKERYAPWSGKPMEGELELEHEGRRLVLRRWSEGKIPFGKFEARDAESGAVIRELTAQNCAQLLLGVERSVFARSGFIRFQDMPVTEDDALRRRLNALVTTGDESEAADRLAQRLKELKHKCRYHKTGLIPQCSRELSQLEQQLTQTEELARQLERDTLQEQAMEQELEQLRLHRKWLEHYRARESQLRLTEAELAVEAAAEALQQAASRCKTHPSREQLRRQLQENPLPPEGGLWPVWLGAVLLLAAGVLGWLGRQWAYWYLAVAAPAAAGIGCIAACLLLRRRRGQRSRELKQRRALWEAALADWEALERSRAELERARETAQLLKDMVFSAPEPAQPDPMDLSREQTRERMRYVRDKVGQCRLARGELMGRMESLPQPEMLQSRIEACRARLQELERYYTALSYAQNALEEAMERLHRRFAPRITRRAQQLLQRLTQGRYDQLYWSQELSLTAAARDESVQRSSLWRSDGTADQMYLALRIAVWEELTPGVPLILDDALVRFDEGRLAATRQVLSELAQTHQVIVFTCR